METSFYRDDVEFLDPLSALQGVDAYRNNVDLLAARTPLGSVLFEDAGILLHKVELLGPQRLRTRWTLRMTMKVLPWSPTARFTGVSEYYLDPDNKIAKQQDYWDSVNLESGTYSTKGRLAGLADLVAQLLPGAADKAGALGNELPFTLLRRGLTYDVRRYPKARVARTRYTQRPEAFDRLGSFAGGNNAANSKLQPLAPSLVVVDQASDTKTMEWPLSFFASDEEDTEHALPEPASSLVSLEDCDYDTVAVISFSEALTGQAVQQYHDRLVAACVADGLTPADSTKTQLRFAQYDPIFSLSTRRNEVWVPLKEHDW